MAGQRGGACAPLGLDHARYHHRVARRAVDRLADLPPAGRPPHRLPDWEKRAIVELPEAWGGIDRPHRKLAHHGYRIDLVHVPEPTVGRALAAEGLVLPGQPAA